MRNKVSNVVISISIGGARSEAGSDRRSTCDREARELASSRSRSDQRSAIKPSERQPAQTSFTSCEMRSLAGSD
jgi:hypothetical protein